MDITVNGKPIKAVAVPSKQAYLYTFDRVTGQPVWPIEERPVPSGKVPGEWYSPTQPYPTKPAAYDMQGIRESDVHRLDAGDQGRSAARAESSQVRRQPLRAADRPRRRTASGHAA